MIVISTIKYCFYIDNKMSYDKVITEILAHFPKIKLGLSNHQSVCLSEYLFVPVYGSPTNNFLTVW
jgi:hypothetical protein